MSNETGNKRKDVGAAWTRTSQAGQKYWSMKVELGGEKYDLVAFKNGYKETENQPDIKIYLSEKKAESKPVPAKGSATKVGTTVEEFDSSEETVTVDEDIF